MLGSNRNRGRHNDFGCACCTRHSSKGKAKRRVRRVSKQRWEKEARRAEADLKV